MESTQLTPAIPTRYNQDVKTSALAAAAVLLAVLSLGGCSKDIQNKEALRAGVIDYLASKTATTGLDPKLMDVDVSGMSFEKDQARATVVFRPKGSSEGAGMTMNYAFDRKGDHWVVRGRQDNGANPHGSGMALPGAGDGTQLPPGHVQVSPGGAGDGTQLPPGHVPVPNGGATGGSTLPPGHPPTSPKE